MPEIEALAYAGLPLVEEHRMAAGSLGDNYRIIRTYDSAGNQLTERTEYLTGVSVGTDEFCSTNTHDQPQPGLGFTHNTLVGTRECPRHAAEPSTLDRPGDSPSALGRADP